MADEFAKGFGILVTAGLGWMTMAGWYCTPSFEGAQLTGECTSAGTIYDQLALTVMDGLFWFAVLGFLTFVVLIPAFREARKSLDEGGEA
jgi:hypothetical protein